MPTPVSLKNWQFAPNQQTVTGGNLINDHKTLILAIKNILSGSGSNFSNPWKAAGSSDGVTAAMDGIDRWNTIANITWVAANGTAHSWIVLRQPIVANSCSLLIDCVGGNAANPQAIYMALSPVSGFSGGSTTAAPSAADQIVLRTGKNQADGYWFGNYGGANLFNSVRIHGWQSTDGKITRIMAMTASVVNLFWGVEEVYQPTTGSSAGSIWSPPIVCYTLGDANGATTPVANFAHMFAAYPVRLFTAFTGDATGSFSSEYTNVAANNQPVAQQMSGTNEISANFPMCPLGYTCVSVGARGRVGKVFDMWFGSPNVATGDTYPATAGFAQFSNVILVWNSGTVLTS